MAWLRINNAGDSEVGTIRAIREVTGWGLKESKEFVESITNKGTEYCEILPSLSTEQALEILETEGIRAAKNKDYGVFCWR